ncbi:MAG: S41 family peptidase [Agriterribacter sp.]
MKKAFFILLPCLCFSIAIFAQSDNAETKKIAIFCKVWGFLKYYHPAVASGRLDWDKAFVTRIDSLPAYNSKKSLSNFFVEWINSLEKPAPCKKCQAPVADSLQFNLNNDWLKDTSLFSSELISQFQYIIDNRNIGDNYYVSAAKFVGNTVYDNENPYKDSTFPSPQLRLLGLSRYWNIINYFFPYKYVIGENWDDVLKEMIPKFRHAENTTAYHLAIVELVAKTNDSHAGIFTPYVSQYFGLMSVPFQTKIVDDKAIVVKLYNDSLCKADDIRLGDVFSLINGISIREMLDKQSKYTSASNQAVKYRNESWTIFNGKTDSVRLQFERDSIVASKTIKRYPRADLTVTWNAGSDTVSILNDNIGYVNMGLLEQSQVESMIKKLQNTKAIIFDVRNYPQGTMYKIAEFLNKDSKPFVKITTPDLSYPGIFNYSKALACGKKNNKNYYKGKVVLLFNELTQSHAEFTLMALQTAPDVIGIGSQTAGADGNVSLITFPGDYQTYMTGIGVYYPDGRPTQRVGIVPDIVVTPTIQGIRAGKDELLDKALQVIHSK